MPQKAKAPLGLFFVRLPILKAEVCRAVRSRRDTGATIRIGITKIDHDITGIGMGRGVNSSAITPNHVAHPRHLRRGECCGGWCYGRYGGLTPLRRHQPPIRAILRTPTWRHDRAIGANLNGRWYGIRRSRWGHRWRWPCWCWRTRCRWLRGRRARLRERNPRAIPACLQAIATLRMSARADANQILG